MTVGAVCEVLPGYAFPEELQGKSVGRYPFCKVRDVSKAVAEAGGALESAANYVDERDVSELRAKPLPIGTTVFAKIGEALRLNRRAITKRECFIDNNVVGLKSSLDMGDDYFIYLTSQRIDLTEYCGGAVPSVNKTTLEAISIPIPGLREQRKIAACLFSLDGLIAAEAKTLDTLKVYKKGLMQQLFPQEGEMVPQLRFPEFRGMGEWRLRTLEEVCAMQAGKFVAASEIFDNQAVDRYPCFGGNGLRGYTMTFTHSGRYSLIGRQGALCGNVNFVQGDFYATEHAVVATPKAGTDTGWLYFELSFLDLNQYATGQAQPGLSVEVLEKVECVIPELVDEQSRIADFLSSLDQRIATQAQKVEALKIHKKGLMHQLFPAMAEGTE